VLVRHRYSIPCVEEVNLARREAARHRVSRLPACPPARLPACPPARLPASPPARLPARLPAQASGSTVNLRRRPRKATTRARAAGALPATHVVPEGGVWTFPTYIVYLPSAMAAIFAPDRLGTVRTCRVVGSLFLSLPFRSSRCCLPRFPLSPPRFHHWRVGLSPRGLSTCRRQSLTRCGHVEGRCEGCSRRVECPCEHMGHATGNEIAVERFGWDREPGTGGNCCGRTRPGRSALLRLR